VRLIRQTLGQLPVATSSRISRLLPVKSSTLPRHHTHEIDQITSHKLVLVKILFFLTAILATPGPGTYLLPSDFGYLVDTTQRSGTTGPAKRRVMVAKLKLTEPIVGSPKSIDKIESVEFNKFTGRGKSVERSKNVTTTQASTAQYHQSKL